MGIVWWPWETFDKQPYKGPKLENKNCIYFPHIQGQQLLKSGFLKNLYEICRSDTGYHIPAVVSGIRTLAQGC